MKADGGDVEEFAYNFCFRSSGEAYSWRCFGREPWMDIFQSLSVVFNFMHMEQKT